jgi:hypothetical protein
MHKLKRLDNPLINKLFEKRPTAQQTKQAKLQTAL